MCLLPKRMEKLEAGYSFSTSRHVSLLSSIYWCSLTLEALAANKRVIDFQFSCQPLFLKLGKVFESCKGMLL